jgi:3-oxoacyl-[acyl-carrier protein] reductase
MVEAPRVMLITGASRGIGRLLAERYLSAGWKVAGLSRNESDLIHPDYRHLCADVSDETSVRQALDAVRREFGRLDCLLNNAGIAKMNVMLLTPVATARRIMDTNFFGAFIVTRDAVRLLRNSPSARIVNFTTVAVPLDLPGEVIYAASKSAVESMTRIAAREFAELGITVNAIGPTAIPTDLLRGVPARTLDELKERQAIKRQGSIDDVANVVDFFLRPESAFITGQVLYLGGIS